jgi:uncharacterized protein
MKPAMPFWKVFIVLIIFPAAYILYSLSPWSEELFRKSNGDYFIPFFSGLILLHWSTFFVCRWFVKSSGWEDSDVGFTSNRKEILKWVSVYLLIALVILGLVEMVIMNAGLNPEKLKRVGDFFPKTTSQRLLFIITAFSAGFCEEYIYRGFGIRALESNRVKTWLALIITSIFFTFIHGIIAFQKFPFYFVPGLLFGLLFLWTKNLKLPIIVHSLIDLGALMMILQAVD